MEMTALRWLVFHRDGGCIAVDPDKVGAEHVVDTPCGNQYGYDHRSDDLLQMTLEHVREFAAMGAPKAPDEPWHCVTLCRKHGVQAWELSHKDQERAYLARLYPEQWSEWLERQA
jgi:hypothetical protein